MSQPSVSQIYRETRERLVELLRSLDEREVDTLVPACPAWTVKDLVSHLSGLVADWTNQNLQRYGTEGWTEAQVEERRRWPLERIIDEWQSHSGKFETVMDDPESVGLPFEMPYLAIGDISVHEQDIRGAVGRPGGRDSAAVDIGMKTYVTGFRRRHSGTGLPVLLLRETDGRDWPIGQGEPETTVAAPRFELFRALSGRRTRAQLRAFDWTGDADPYMEIFMAPGFEWPASDLIE